MSGKKLSRPSSKYQGISGQWRCGECGQGPDFEEQTSPRGLEHHILIHHRQIGRVPDLATWVEADNIEAHVVRLRKSQGRGFRHKTNARYFGFVSKASPSAAAGLAAQAEDLEEGEVIEVIRL